MGMVRTARIDGTFTAPLRRLSDVSIDVVNKVPKVIDGGAHVTFKPLLGDTYAQGEKVGVSVTETTTAYSLASTSCSCTAARSSTSPTGKTPTSDMTRPRTTVGSTTTKSTAASYQ